MQHKGSIPSEVVIALYCNKKGYVLMQEVVTPEIIADRVLEYAYLPVPRDVAHGYEEGEGKGDSKGHGPEHQGLCVAPCFNCTGPGGVPCCCNCPPKP
jgi:hypothetical protein